MPSFKAAVVVIAAAAALGAASIPASGDATDFANGVVIDASDIANATLAASLANAGSPDVTCGNPTAEGSTVTPATNAHPVGTVDGNDIANGTGQCVTLQGTFFSATLITQIEYLPKGGSSYLPIPGCFSKATTSSISGAALPVNPTVSCNYPETAAWAFQPHRVHSILTNSLTTNRYDGYSPVYNTDEIALSVQTG